MLRSCLLVLLTCLAAAPSLQAREGPSPSEVHEAIERGTAWLKKRIDGQLESETFHSVPELAVLTLSHAGVRLQDKVLAAALTEIVSNELTFTYRVSTLAMALGRINPYKYRARLAYCAQWLVDTQLPGGEWGYPGTVRGRTNETRAEHAKPPVTEKDAAGGPKAPPIVITRRSDPARYAGAQGDFSNTQFALLGLRACLDARIEVPKTTWQTALAYQLKFQQKDGSWGYVVAGEQDEAGYASLTCAGLVGVAICLHGLGKSPRSHPAVKRGLKWLARHWTPQENAGIEDSSIIPPSTWQYYQLYAVERVGRVLNQKKIGKRKWYPEGAAWLLAQQKADGSWEDPGGDTTGRNPPYLRTADTCFALLFLTLATPPLTGG